MKSSIFLRKHRSKGLLLVIFLTVQTIEFGNSEYCDNQVSSVWDPFCTEDLYYKPYLRIRQGRNGELIKDRGPGFIDVKGMEDLYICANGLVFLYFKIVRTLGEVYDEGVMQYAAHRCGFYNGKPGPGVEQRKISLVAVLLLGHPQDLRKISLQMFTAPMYANTTVANYTSLAITNTEGECLIQKGQARIRVKGNPPQELASRTYAENEEKHTVICRLDARKFVKEPDQVPLDKDFATTTEEAMKMLKLSPEADMRFSGCYEYPLLDEKQNEIIASRVLETSNATFGIDKVKSELNPGDGAGLRFWTKARLEKYGDPLAPPPDEPALKAEVETHNVSYYEELAKPPKSRDKEKLTADKAKLAMATVKLKLASFFRQYQKVFESAKEAATNAKTEWEAVSQFVKGGTVDENRKKYLEALRDISQFTFNMRLDPYNLKLLENIKDAENRSREFKQKLKEQTLENAPKITKAEVQSARVVTYKNEALKIMNKVQQIIYDFEVSKKPPSLTGNFEGQPGFHDTVISIKNLDGALPGKADTPCLTFERMTDQCKSIKPTPQRACQLGRNSILKPENWPGGESDSWRDEVFQLLEKIFMKACPYLDGGFVRAINGIVKGYLIKEPEGAGIENGTVPGAPQINHTRDNFISHYKITTMEDLYPKLNPKNSDVWDQALDALRKCEHDAYPLKFDYAGMRPLRFTFKGREVPINVEQAGKEFAFNWAVDMNFKVFSTVLGICLKKLESSSGGITLAQKFYRGYSDDFLAPIRPIWLSNRDNSVLMTVLGKYFITGKADLWTTLCMEGSFIESTGDAKKRPARKLFVNSYTEPNFFSAGPLKGSRGHFYTAEPTQ